MGTREVYEENLRRGNLPRDPTIKPGLDAARCPRCLSLLNSSNESSKWDMTLVLHDATAVAGSGLGGLLSAIHGFNTGIPYVQKYVRGPKWLPFIVGVDLLEPVPHFLDVAQRILTPYNSMGLEEHKAVKFFGIQLQRLNTAAKISFLEIWRVARAIQRGELT